MDIVIGGQSLQNSGSLGRAHDTALSDAFRSNDSTNPFDDKKTASGFADATQISLSGASAQAFSTDQVVSAINASLSSSGLSIQGVDPSDYTPDAVANRILDQVGNLITTNASNAADARKILDQASQGISDGIDKANDTLKALGAYNDTVAGSINDTRKQLEDGLKALDQRVTQLFDTSEQKSADDQSISQPADDTTRLQTQVTQTAQTSQFAAESATVQERNRPQYTGFNANRAV